MYEIDTSGPVKECAECDGNGKTASEVSGYGESPAIRWEVCETCHGGGVVETDDPRDVVDHYVRALGVSGANPEILEKLRDALQGL